jgi:hypothetical protein
VADGLKTREQILASADFYGPTIYSALQFYSNFEHGQDWVSADFIPLTSAKPNPKLFVVGLLPPTSNISGKLLDRSASIRNLQGGGEQSLDLTQSSAGADTGPAAGAGGAVSATGGTGSGLAGYIVTAPGYTITQGQGNVNIGAAPGGVPPGPNGEPPTFNNFSVPQLWSILREAYQQLYGREPTATELQFYTAQCLRETSGKLPNNNFGFIGNYNKPPAGKETFLNANGKYFNSYPSPVDGAKAFLGHIPANAKAAAQSGDAMGYMTSLAQTGYYGEPVKVYYHGTAASPKEGIFPALLGQVSRSMAGTGVTLDNAKGLPAYPPEGCAFNEDIFQYRDRNFPGWKQGKGGMKPGDQFRFMPGSIYPSTCPLAGQTPQTAETKTSFAGEGSENAKAAAKEASKVGDKDLNKTELGKKFLAAQAGEILATAAALETMKNTPPLRFLVNPSSFKVASEKIISDSNWTRNGPIIEHWGDGQDKIDFSGKVAAFFAIDANPPGGGVTGAPGLTRVARNYSASYHNFLSLWLLYRNNAGIYVNDPTTGNGSTRLSMVGSVYIYYDSILYIGSFDSFNLTESATSPHTLEYSVQFTVRAMFLLDQPSPEGTYGAPKLFSKGEAIPAPGEKQDADPIDDDLFAEGRRAAAEARLRDTNLEYQRQAAEFDKTTVFAPESEQDQITRKLQEEFAKNPPKGSTKLDPAVKKALRGDVKPTPVTKGK